VTNAAVTDAAVTDAAVTNAAPAAPVELDPLRQKSAELLLRLYEARREPTLRAAREWFVTRFHPASADEVLAAWMAPDSGPYRMTTTYWEMAAGFVLHGAIDAAMFHATNTEYVAVYAKLEPYLAEVRERAGVPAYLAGLEALVRQLPDYDAQLATYRRYMALKRKQLGGGAAPPA
jgi:hypothetical protein